MGSPLFSVAADIFVEEFKHLVLLSAQLRIILQIKNLKAKVNLIFDTENDTYTENITYIKNETNTINKSYAKILSTYAENEANIKNETNTKNLKS